MGRDFSLFISLQPVTGRHDVCQELQNFLPKDPDAKGLGNIICSNQPYWKNGRNQLKIRTSGVLENLQNFLPKDPDAKGLGNIVCSIGPTILLEKWKEPIEN